MTIHVCTFNVKGLASREKRIKVFEYLKDKKYTICLLQEIHCKENTDIETWKKEWQNDIYISGDSSNSKGIGINYVI